MAVEYLRLTDHSKVVELIGPFAMNKKVISELTYPITTNDRCIWYVAAVKGNVIGFCCLDNKKCTHAYVSPNHRGNGVYSQLFHLRQTDFKNQTITAVCTNKSVNTFLRNGFKITKQTKNYTFVTKTNTP
jgi:predicted GNAT family acetyltransferase